MILATHGIISSSGSSFDADALAFITAASITDNTQKTAVNTLVTDLKNANIWTKMKALYPFVGGNATSHKYNLKDPRDLDAAFRLTFSGGWTHSSTGALPNGINSYSDTFVQPSAHQTDYTAHLSIYSRTSASALTSVAGHGISDSAIKCSYMIIRRGLDNIHGGAVWEDGSYNAVGVSSSPNGQGFHVLSRTSLSLLNFYKNNTLLYTNTSTVPTPTLSTSKYFLSAINGVGSPTINTYDNKELSFASIGAGLDSTESTALYNAVNTFNTTLNRQV